MGRTYIHHLAALSEESSVKSSDRAKLRGYHTKWIEGKYLIGCAVFVDLLTPCFVFSKVMQSDEVDILTAVTVQPRLSGPRLSGPSIIRTSWRLENTLPRMRRRRGQ